LLVQCLLTLLTLLLLIQLLLPARPLAAAPPQPA
jgi:hypothetical protein